MLTDAVNGGVQGERRTEWCFRRAQRTFAGAAPAWAGAFFFHRPVVRWSLNLANRTLALLCVPRPHTRQPSLERAFCSRRDHRYIRYGVPYMAASDMLTSNRRYVNPLYPGSLGTQSSRLDRGALRKRALRPDRVHDCVDVFVHLEGGRGRIAVRDGLRDPDVGVA